MQVGQARSLYSRFKNKINTIRTAGEPPSRSSNLRTKPPDQEKHLRDLVADRFMQMDEDHNRIRDQFLGDISNT